MKQALEEATVDAIRETMKPKPAPWKFTADDFEFVGPTQLTKKESVDFAALANAKLAEWIAEAIAACTEENYTPYVAEIARKALGVGDGNA